MKKPKFYIVWQFDPLGKKIGGIGRFVLSILPLLVEKFDVTLIGVTENNNELGKKIKIDIEGCKVWFIPILAINERNKKKLLPVSVFFVFKLFVYRDIFESTSFIFLQRVEYLLSLRNAPARSFVLYHYDIERYLEKSTADSYWAYFPVLFNFLNKFLLDSASKVFSVSNSSIKYLEKNGIVEVDDSCFLPTWPNRNVFNTFPETSVAEYRSKLLLTHQLNSDSIILSLVGRLNTLKNISLAIDVLSMLPDRYVLFVAGDGDMKEQYIAYAKSNALEARCVFLGALDQKKLAYLYNSSDIYLSTSLAEGMSIALLEALSCGLPAVTTPTGESSLVINEINGAVSDGWCAEEISQLIKNVYELNHTSDKRMDISNSVDQWTVESSVSTLLNQVLQGIK